MYYLRNEELVKPFSSEVWDMEDITQAGREMTEIRKTMDLNVDNAIVIIDEAHNIEDVARDAGGHDITLDTLTTADSQLRHMINQNIKAEACRTLLTLVVSFQRIIEKQVFPESFEAGTSLLTLKVVLEELKEFGFSHDSVRDMGRASETLNKALRDKAEMNKQHLMDGDESRTQGPTQDERDLEALQLSLGILRALDGLIAVLKRLYDPENDFMEEYKVAVQRALVGGGAHARLEEDRNLEGDHEQEGEASRGPSRTNQKRRSRPKTGEAAEFKETKTLSFWCLSPGVVFRELGWSTRSVVLTSGTLSPMESFASELQTTFAITLEASHVVDESQVWAGAFSSGPHQIKLKGVYATTRSYEYQDEIGHALERISEVVPNGVLCFVTSYTLAEALADRWRATGQWNRLNKLKRLFIETKRESMMGSARMLNDFRAAASGRDSASRGGALLLAIFRGKCSEGIDFTDGNCRAVVAVGIPFPGLNDDKVMLKKAYNDLMRREPKTIFKVTPTLSDIEIPNHSLSEAERIAQEFGRVLERPAVTYGRLVSGQRWYEIQAFRAFNQAIGRCIRHQKDWGAMIFLDCRMQKHEYRFSLSKWIRPLVRNVDKFEGGIEELQRWMARLLESDGSHWRDLETRRVEREASIEEALRAETTNEASNNQEQDDGQHPQEQLTTEDGESLLSFTLDTGVGSSRRGIVNTGVGVVAEPPRQATLKFVPIKHESLTQQRLPFQSTHSSPPMDIQPEVEDRTIDQMHSFTARPMSKSSKQSTTFSAVSAHDTAQNANVVDEVQDYSDEEYHDASQHLGDGDSSMHDAGDPGGSSQGSQGVCTSGRLILREIDVSMDATEPIFNSSPGVRGRSVEMQSPATTPRKFTRQLSFSNPPSLPRSPSFTTDTLQLATSVLGSPPSSQFGPRVAQNSVHVQCYQCNTRLVVCNMRPKVQTVHKLIARELVTNAKRPTRTFSRSSSSSSLSGASTSLTQVVGESRSVDTGSNIHASKSGPSTTALPSTAMMLMFPKGSIVTKDYEAAGIAATPQDVKLSQPWQTEGLVCWPIVCWTCRTNQMLYPPQRSQTGEDDGLPFGHEQEPGWRGVFVASLTPRLLSFSSGLSTSQPSSQVTEDQGFVGQTWFAPKEVRVVV
ncbi:Fanconi anemia group J protein [Actinomortierella ambigua]|nr:Fanconi anemia group J protein [Actinomortierella ambigua]